MSTTFIECTTTNFGGGILAERECKSSFVCWCSFIDCSAFYGGGLMTYFGPYSQLSSSRFISCAASQTGGGMYHEGNSPDYIILRDSLFTDNHAYYAEYRDNTRGGGAFEDYRSHNYDSTYSFSFFTGNTAPTGVGNDISIHDNKLDAEHIIHCFTTASSDSFWNNGTYTDSQSRNWLQKGIAADPRNNIPNTNYFSQLSLRLEIHILSPLRLSTAFFVPDSQTKQPFPLFLPILPSVNV